MTIKVERTISAFRLTMPNGDREFVSNSNGDYWNREAARKALDLLESVYGFKRTSIRFMHLN